ncbi:quinone oxidoreductase [Grosmannia clavigera kw1407]|uniref:Probable quinone oxidoreductase n=1 Tax=Grosmannia clavigera (strain kw1407 / UAMH 11150) TaxID=655863 RepID=F0XAV4_GROCL|nr:quinone oxidoreductase [Grosmannia clavigera kw1407]EFX05182.1 quinone oxidoreductase [Grosmannia clavigera kw1407]
MMKAVQFSEYGSTDVLTVVDIPKPTAEASQVLIRVEYAGVNFIDTYLRTGLYTSVLPATAGREAGGVIEHVGEAVPAEYGLAVGDRVAVFGPAALAEYMAAEASTVLKLPESVSTREGAALILQGLTAWTLVRDAHDVKAGETVLVQAAAGGTGGLLVQMAKALGATVIGTASTPAKIEVARKHGCDHVINYAEDDMETEVLRLTDGQGCHAVFSGVGKATLVADMNVTRRKGTFVTFGNSSGAIESVRPLDLSRKNIKLVRPTLTNYIATREEFSERSAELVDLVASGRLSVSIGGEYGLHEVGKAQDALVARKTVGKLVIKVQ